MSVVAGRIKELIEEWGISYTRMEKTAGLGQETVEKICTGKNRPESWTIVRICDTYQISVDWMLGRTENRGARWKWNRTESPEALRKTFSHNLRRVLWRKQISAPEFSKISGISESAIYNHMRAETVVRSDNLALYCEYLNVSADWLLGRKEG